jgi:hypothetical protein
MWKQYSAVSLLFLFALGSFSACSKEGEVDPYALVTLRQATQGSIVSKGFKYRFDNPQILQVNDHVGLIREGNLIEFVGGRSLQSRLEGLTGNFQLCVIKEYKPFVHFRVEKIYTEGDTIFISQAGAINYPNIIPAEKFDHSGFEDFDVDRLPVNRTATLKDQVDKKFFVSCSVEEIEEEGGKFFVLAGNESKVKVIDPTDGIAVMLKLLKANNYPFEGGFTFTGMEENFPYRKRTGIVGTAEVNFIKYGRTVVSI